MNTASSFLQRQSSLITSNEYCTIHPQLKAAFLCLDSDCHFQSVCLDCVSTVHRGHELEKITTFMASMETYVTKQIQTGKEDHLNPLSKEIELTETMITKSASDSKETQQKILERKSELQAEIEEVTDMFVRSCRTAEMRNKRKLGDHKKTLLNRKEILNEVISRYEEALDSLSHLDITQLNLLMEFPIEPHRSRFPKLSNFGEFQPTSIPDTTKHIEHIFGINTESKKTDNEFYLLQMVSPHTKIKFVRFLLDQLCIWSWNDKHVLLVNRQGLITHSISLQPKTVVEADNDSDGQEDEAEILQTRESDFEISDLIISPIDYTVWFCCSDGVVRQITSGGEFQDRIYTAWNPLALCVCGTGHIIVGFVDQISRYNLDGEKVQAQDLDKLGKAAEGFGCPRSISCCKQTSHIAVLGFADVFVLDKNFNFLWSYRKALQSKNVCKAGSIFEPETICHDGKGRVIIADHHNTIYVIDREQNVKKIQCLQDQYPTAMCLMEDNHVCIALTNKLGKIPFIQVKLPA